MVNSDGFWQNRKVLLTGHTGFKGSWLSVWLTRLGAQVTGYALKPNQEPALFTALEPWPGLRSEIADVRHLDRLRRLMDEVAPDLVIHMAAQSLVLRSYAKAVDTFDVNVMGTVNVLEAVRLEGAARAVLVVTTDKVYRNFGSAPEPFHEDAPLGSSDPYSSSKAAAELVAASYRSSFLAKEGIALATARAGNVIGGGDWSDNRLIPDLVRGAYFGQPVRIRYPHAVRPWQHVLEALHGYLLLGRALIERPAAVPEALNFGPDADAFRPVGEVIELFLDSLGTAFRPTIDLSPKAHEAAVLTLDSQLARSSLDWRPRLGLPEALDLTARWYAGFAVGQDARTLCNSQISFYEAHQAATAPSEAHGT